jgi:hypothetical protein
MIPEAKPIILHTRGAYRFKTQINAAGAPKVYRNKPWVVWPTCQPEIASRQVAKWRDLSYHVGLLVEGEADIPGADFIIRQEKWRGFPAAANMLCAEAIKRGAKVVCVAGDDIEPDPQTPGPEILDRYHKHFPDDYGVMQPTGDKFGAFDTCCISPWIGRQFIERTYGGSGPYFEGYNHCFCDKELQDVAKKLERFYQVPNLCQRHNHWTRTRVEAPHHERIKATIGADETLYRARWGANFPGYLVSK